MARAQHNFDQASRGARPGVPRPEPAMPDAAPLGPLGDPTDPDDRPERPPLSLPLLDPGPLFDLLADITKPLAWLAYLVPPLAVVAGYAALFRQHEIADHADRIALTLPFWQSILFGLLTANLLGKLAQGIAMSRQGARSREFGLRLAFGVVPRVYIDHRPIARLDPRAQRACHAAPLLLRLALFAGGILLWDTVRRTGSGLADLAVVVAGIGLASFLLTANPLWPADGYRWLAAATGRPRLRSNALRVLRLAIRARRLPPDLSSGEFWLLLLYAVVSLAFTATIAWLVVSAVAYGLEAQFRGTGVVIFGLLLAAVATFLLSRRRRARPPRATPPRAATAASQAGRRSGRSRGAALRGTAGWSVAAPARAPENGGAAASGFARDAAGRDGGVGAGTMAGRRRWSGGEAAALVADAPVERVDADPLSELLADAEIWRDEGNSSAMDPARAEALEPPRQGSDPSLDDILGPAPDPGRGAVAATRVTEALPDDLGAELDDLLGPGEALHGYSGPDISPAPPGEATPVSAERDDLAALLDLPESLERLDVADDWPADMPGSARGAGADGEAGTQVSPPSEPLGPGAAVLTGPVSGGSSGPAASVRDGRPEEGLRRGPDAIPTAPVAPARLPAPPVRPRQPAQRFETNDLDRLLRVGSSRPTPARRWRTALIWLAVLGVLAWAAFLPYPFEVGGEFTVQPLERAEARSRTDGEIIEINVREGDRVEAGEVMAVLSNWDELRDVAINEADGARLRADLAALTAGASPEQVEVARRAVATAELRVQAAQRALDREQALFEAGTIPAATLEDSRAAHDLALASRDEAEAALAVVTAPPRQPQVDALDAEIARNDEELAFSRLLLEYTNIRAPVGGQVVSSLQEVPLGAYLTTGGLFAELEDNRVVIAEVEVPETTISEVSVGAPAELRLWSDPETPIEGTVRSVAPRAEERDFGWIIRVQVEVPNPDGRLAANMTGFAKISAAERPAWQAFSRAIERFVVIELWSWLP